jgi:hypothetical protein
MYLPVTYSTAAPAGMSGYRRMDAALQESEFYPPPYDSDSPFDLASVYSGRRGLGFFDSMDFTTWGWQEWLSIAAAGYLGLKLIGDVGRGTGRVRRAVRSRQARRARKKRLQEELAGL